MYVLPIMTWHTNPFYPNYIRVKTNLAYCLANIKVANFPFLFKRNAHTFRKKKLPSTRKLIRHISICEMDMDPVGLEPTTGRL